MNEEVQKYVGKRALVGLGGLSVIVTITDIKNSYGKLRFNITPVSGSGSVWVETVHLIEEQ